MEQVRIDIEKSGLSRFRVRTSETSLATEIDISANVVDGAMDRRTTSFQRSYSGMIAAHTLWKQTYSITSFECLEGMGKLHCTRGPRTDGFYLHEFFHHLGVVNVTLRKVLASLDGDSSGRLDKPASERLTPELGRLGGQAQHIAYLADSAQ